MANYSTREASNNPHQKNYRFQEFYSRYVKNLKPVGNGQLRMDLIADGVTNPAENTGRGVDGGDNVVKCLDAPAHIKD